MTKRKPGVPHAGLFVRRVGIPALMSLPTERIAKHMAIKFMVPVMVVITDDEARTEELDDMRDVHEYVKGELNLTSLEYRLPDIDAVATMPKSALEVAWDIINEEEFK